MSPARAAAAGRAGCSAAASRVRAAGVLAAAHDLEELSAEFDLADAAAAELDVEAGVVAALAPASRSCAASSRIRSCSLDERREGGVVEVAAEDERRDHLHQRLFVGPRSRPRSQAGVGDDPRLEPGEALPFAALLVEVLLEHAQRADQRARVAVGPQAGVDPEHEAVGGRLRQQVDHPPGDPLRTACGCGPWSRITNTRSTSDETFSSPPPSLPMPTTSRSCGSPSSSSSVLPTAANSCAATRSAWPIASSARVGDGRADLRDRRLLAQRRAPSSPASAGCGIGAAPLPALRLQRGAAARARGSPRVSAVQRRARSSCAERLVVAAAQGAEGAAKEAGVALAHGRSPPRGLHSGPRIRLQVRLRFGCAGAEFVGWQATWWA